MLHVAAFDLEGAIDLRGCGPMRLFIRDCTLRSVTLPIRARRNAEAFTVLMDRPRAVDWADDVKNTTLFKILLSIKSLGALGRCVTLLFRFIREGNVCRPAGWQRGTFAFAVGEDARLTVGTETARALSWTVISLESMV